MALSDVKDPRRSGKIFDRASLALLVHLAGGLSALRSKQSFHGNSLTKPSHYWKKSSDNWKLLNRKPDLG